MMFFKQLFARKSLETLHAEAMGENRLRRVLGPIGLTSLGIGAIIGAGIFVMTGRVAADNAGPAVMVSYAVAGLGCALAAFCYAEFASMAPVAGSAYTYAYATLGELLAWIIGWDLILEYAMSCATVASAWSEYFNKLTHVLFNWQVPDYLTYDPISHPGAWLNLPAVLILLAVTVVLVIGIRESAASNTVLVVIKLGVVIFVIVMGFGYIAQSNWFNISSAERKMPAQILVGDKADDQAKYEDALIANARKWAAIRFDEQIEKAKKSDSKSNPLKDLTIQVGAAGAKDVLADVDELTLDKRAEMLKAQALTTYMVGRTKEITAEMVKSGEITEEEAKKRVANAEKDYELRGPKTEAERARANSLIEMATKEAPAKAAEQWGLLGTLGLNSWLLPLDEKTRSNFAPYGFSGIMLGAALVFFAFIGFDSISTHAEEAIKPQRDVPIGIIASLAICTVLYMAVSAVITGMQAYPNIDTKAAIASAFSERAEIEKSSALKASAALIAAGGLAGMTSVLLITFLSQARVFLAMARDGLMSQRIFGSVHEKFRTPHMSTMLTGGVICLVAAFTPIQDLEKMVNIGTLFAFVIVCGAVLLLRIRRPEVHRPFRCPMLFVLAPLGILVNVTMMLFLPITTWLRLVIWLAIGLVIYFGYGYWHSMVGKQLRRHPHPQKV
jgi:amino acid transporter/polyhydroxyalkanoate synthesis regulator phasin